MASSNFTSLRSEPMSLIQLYVPLEVTKQTLIELGELGIVEFRDLNSQANTFERPYIKDITRLEEYEQKLLYIYQKIKDSNVYVSAPGEDREDVNFYKQQELEMLENTIDEYHKRLKNIDESLSSFGQNYIQASVRAKILRGVQRYLHDDPVKEFSIEQAAEEPTELSKFTDQDTRTERAETNITTTKFLFVAGVVQRRILPVFEQIVFRVLRGNSFMQFSEIPEEVTPTNEKLSNMVVFAIFLHGKEMLKKMEKICSLICFITMKVDCYYNDIEEGAKEYERKCEDLTRVIINIKNTLLVELTNASERMNTWWNIITKEKAIYNTLSMFKVDKSTNRNTLIGEGWCPSDSIETIRESLRGVTSRAGTSMCPFISVLKQRGMVLPTYIKTSEFTNPAQEIVNSFSIPAYREVNPGLFTVVTFPFLFSLMFGDAGHGAVIALFAMWIIYRARKYDKKKAGELYTMIHNGRHLILLMGLFSVYSGLIYSDALSLPLQLFRSGWQSSTPNGPMRNVGTYWFGIDYAWHHALNSIIFINSYKMKLSIVIGVIHMVGGIFINLMNYTNFKQRSRIFTEFIPQMLFMLCLFGYLAFIIILKWCMNFPDPEKAPSLLAIMISMVLSPTSLPEANRLYPGQATVQIVLLLLAVVSVPWMLLSEPIYAHYFKNKNHKALRPNTNDADNLNTDEYIPVKIENATAADEYPNNEKNRISSDEVTVPMMGVAEPDTSDEAPGAEGEHNSLGEELIHKSIHTIEFCLNALSNTASYLRIWALSLAHSELSKINWNMLMGNALSSTGPSQVPMLIIFFIVWLALTIAILICMEGLSAFLHTLRLHWIEFHSKFYIGNGVKFTPLCFKKIISESKKA